MKHRTSLAKLLVAEIVVIFIALIFIYNVSSAQEGEHYEDANRLNLFSYGVEESNDIGEFVSLSYQNNYNTDKTVTTTGKVAFPPDIRLLKIKIDYIITDGEDRVLRTVSIINKPTDSSLYQFSVTYPFMADYEKCIFEIYFVGEEIDDEGPEKLNV